MQKFLLILISLILSSTAIAKVPVDGVVAVCSPYPAIANAATLPKVFNSTNNLARPVDSAFYQAEGEKIVVYGRVMDNNCTPLSAKIYIWQANKEGYVQYPLKTPGAYKNSRKKWIDPNFAGNGTTNSDNMGRFSFITIKPGANGKITPHINIMVQHPSFKTLSSKIYFPNDGSSRITDSKSIKNPTIVAQVSAVPEGAAQDGYQVYFIDITLSQNVEYNEY